MQARTFIATFCLIILVATVGAGTALAVNPADYVAANDCTTGSTTATLTTVPMGMTLLVTDIHIGSNELTGTVTSPYDFEFRQSGQAVQRYRLSPRATNGFAQSGAIDFTQSLGSPLVITENNTLQVVATLPGSWSSVEWCASISGYLVSNLALGAVEPSPEEADGPQLAVFPNPGDGEQYLRFSMKEPAHVTLDIFNVGGQRVARLQDSVMPAGNHQLSWNGIAGDGTRVANGTYYPRLTVSGETVTGRMVVLN